MGERDMYLEVIDSIQGPREVCVMCSGAEPGRVKGTTEDPRGCVLCDGEGTTAVHPAWDCDAFGHSFGHGPVCFHCGCPDCSGTGRAPEAPEADKK